MSDTTNQTPGTAARLFLQKVEQALDNMATLTVKTVVGEVDVAADLSVTPQPGGKFEAAYTTINMLDGHITNVFTSGFAALSGGEMKTLHQSQVEQSKAIVTGNLLELQKLATALMSYRR